MRCESKGLTIKLIGCNGPSQINLDATIAHVAHQLWAKRAVKTQILVQAPEIAKIRQFLFISPRLAALMPPELKMWMKKCECDHLFAEGSDFISRGKKCCYN